MKLDTLGLQAFVAIAEQSSFQKAADALYITQTALTRRLQNFEAQLGVKLIERTTRSVAMTQLGSDFLPQARRLLSELEYAMTEIHKTGSALLILLPRPTKSKPFPWIRRPGSAQFSS